MNVKQLERWSEICIKDSTCLAGSSVGQCLSLVADNLDLQFAVIEDLEGAGIQNLKKACEGEVCLIEHVLGLLECVSQVDFCDLFLYKTYLNSRRCAQMSYPEVISETEATIRAVDDTYLYIYTRSPTLVRKVLDEYGDLQVREGILQEFIYPE